MMDVATLFRAIYNLNPSAKVRVTNADLSTLVWKEDHVGPKPTAAEIEAEYNALVANKPAAELEAKKLAAYRLESDPLFFKWQAGESTEQEWLDKRAEIKARFNAT